MGKPSYNKSACQKLSFEKFKEIHGWVDYFKYLTDAQWKAEYATATGFEAVQVTNSTEVKPVVMKKKPQRKGV